MDNQANQSSTQQLYPPPGGVSSPPPQTPTAPLQYVPPPSSKKRIFLIIGGILGLLFIVILALVFILSRSGNKANEEVTLTMWGLWEDESVYREVINDFERQNPNIKIKYEKQDIKTIGKYIDRLEVRIKNGDGPDIYQFHNSWTPQIKNLLAPLPNSTLKATDFEKQYYDVIKGDMQVGGAYYGIPLGIDTLALYINEEKFQAAGLTPPTTWEDLQKMAHQLTVVNSETGQIEVSGVALGTVNNIAHASDIISLLLVQNGADFKNIAGEDQKLNAQQALEFYTSFAKGENATWNSEMDNSKLVFAKGNLAMYFGYSWDILEIKAINPDLKFKIVPVPHLPGRDETIASYWTEGVSSKSTHAPEAFLFLEFLSQKSSLEKIFANQTKSRGLGTPYPRIDMANLLKDNILYPFVQQAPNAVSTVFSSDTYDARLITSLNAYLSNAINSLLNEDASSETAIEKLGQGMSEYQNRIKEIHGQVPEKK